MSTSTSTQKTVLKFRSSSLLHNTLYDAHTGELVFQLRGGYTYSTIAIDHGGIIGVKNTCVRRPTSFILDANGVNIAYVQWRGDSAVNIWISGRTISVPNLCSEPGEVMGLKNSQKGDEEDEFVGGVSEESIVFPWTLKGNMAGTWMVDDERIVLVDAARNQLAMYTPTAGGEHGNADCGMLQLDAAGDLLIDVVGMWISYFRSGHELTGMYVVTLLAVEAARRKAFGFGPLDITSTPSTKSYVRRDLLKRLKVLVRGIYLRHISSLSNGSSST